MTSGNVTQAVGYFFGAAGAGVAQSAGNAADDSFSKVMSRASQDNAGAMAGSQSGQKTQLSQAPEKTASSAKPDENTPRETVTDREPKTEQTAVTDTDATQAEEPEEKEATEPDEAVLAVLADAIAQVREAIQETLGISGEELDTLMGELGFSQTDLLDPGQMQVLAMAAAGESDAMSLLTDGKLYENVQALTQAVEEAVAGAKEALSMPEDQFYALVQKMDQVQAPGQAVTEGAFDEPVVLISQEEMAPEAADEKQPQTEQAVDGKENGEAKEAVREQEEAVPIHREEKKSSQAESHSGKEGAASQNGSQLLQGFEKPGDAVWSSQQMESTAQQRFSAAESENIMRQVTDYMKLEVKEQATELELQLQPETLGTLRIHLTSKEGVVTAQFTAETEAVRAVLEAQTLQLKENLNEQGIRVEAVEVTVASHEFDRNYAGEGEGDSRYEQPKKRGMRRIRLSGDIPLDEMELTDEERIAAELMRQSGSTVDYMA